MKVLVHFKHEFYSLEVVSFRAIELCTKVFEAESKAHLLHLFENYDFIPYHIRDAVNKAASGRKNMIWYMPESFKPHF